MLIEADSLNRSGATAHGFFTREGGVSDGVYGSLNCGPGSRDRPENVQENRGRAMARFGLGAGDLNTLYQVHSARVVVLEEPLPEGERPQADAFATRVPGLAVGVLTADCAPVLFADSGAGVVGAAHAGWRGALDGVLEATLQAMEGLGADRGNVSAAVGPCIHQASYEVGPEFVDTFVEADAGNGRYFVPSERDGRSMFDLPGYVEGRLNRADIGMVENLGLDTYADEMRFFSYRRTTHLGEGDYGRQLSAIVWGG